MTVEPGFGGAAFLSAMLPKISAVRRALDAGGLPCRLQVDGGINLETVESAAGAGAEVLIAGHGVFGTSDPAGTIRTLRAKAQAAYSGRAG
jgi:ribulose-phosphate 3-epimerase